MEKLRPVIILLAAWSVCGVLLAGCAGMQKPRSNEEAWTRFVGEWENPEYSDVPNSPKRRSIAPDFSITDHYGATAYRIEVNPVRYFGDGEGNFYFQFTFQDPFATGTRPGVGVLRVDKSGTVLEHNWYYGVTREDAKMFESVLEKLEKIDPKLKFVNPMATYNAYTIHHRK